MGLKVATKAGISRIGRTMPVRAATAMERTLDYLALGVFLRRHQMDRGQLVHDREALFELAARPSAGERVLYLEFGVWEGRSMRWWSEHLHDPDAQLHGFDSFEGLPEAWDANNPKGSYSARGQVPDIADARVRFHQGWFADTLTDFEPPAHQRMVVTFDADLYSSTVTALNAVESAVRPGTFFYFDELADRANELRAFDEYLLRSGRRFHAVGVADTYTQWLFECVS